jgi:hypothetical protein
VVITIPTATITTADATGVHRNTGCRLAAAGSGSQCLAYSTIIPIPISTPANPRLNATNSVIPNATRPTAIALSNNTNAEGHGTNPPLAPRASRLPIVISPSGTCE